MSDNIVHVQHTGVSAAHNGLQALCWCDKLAWRCSDRLCITPSCSLHMCRRRWQGDLPKRAGPCKESELRHQEHT